MRAVGWILSAGLALVAGCGVGEGVSGRPGGDQTENGIQAKAVDSSGAPLALARVLVLPARALDSNLVDPRRIEAMTDSVGQILIKGLAPGSYRLEIVHHGKAVQFAANVVAGEIADAGTRTPLPTGSLRGRVKAGVVVAARGLGHWTRSDASGRFQLDSLPTGVVELVASDGAHAWKTVSIGQTSDAGTLRQDSAGQILLDDFEDGDSRHRWAPLVSNGWWYVASSADVASLPAGITSQFWNGIDSVSPERRKAFHTVFDFDTAKSNPWAEVGVGLAGASTGDLSKLTSVNFWAKGSGSFAIHINTRTLGRIETDIQLTSEWKEYDIPLAAFHKGVGADATAAIADILAAATGLAWESTSNAEIWLDEIRLIGVTSKSVWGDLTPP